MGPQAPCFAELGPFRPYVSATTIVCLCPLIADVLQFGRIYLEKVFASRNLVSPLCASPHTLVTTEVFM